MKSRQEEVPLVGEYISVAKCEPLHIKNNVVKEFFVKLLKICVGQSDTSKYKLYKDVPSNLLFVKLVTFIRQKMHCNYLASKIIQWFNESSVKGNDEFRTRFRGKESLCYLKFFPELCHLVLNNVQDQAVRRKVLEIFHCSILLRKAISLVVRIENFSLTLLEELVDIGKQLFKCCCVFFKKMSPSLWTLCQVAPVHAHITLNLYGFGLGCNTMEGREQKHQAIGKYAENTTVKDRWPQIFRHEFIHLVYLRENEFDQTKYTKTTNKYVPDYNDSKCKNCLMGSQPSTCEICFSVEYKSIAARLKKF